MRATSRVCACSVRATSMSPDVSLSSRCTMAGPGNSAQPGIVRQQPVQQRTVAIARTGVDDQPGRLVEHEQVGIFVEDAKRSRLRLRCLVGLDGADDPDVFSARHAIPGPYRCTVESRVAGTDPSLNAGTGVLREHPRKSEVGSRATEGAGNHPFKPDCEHRRATCESAWCIRSCDGRRGTGMYVAPRQRSRSGETVVSSRDWNTISC